MLPLLSPSDFIALTNQTLEYAYPSVLIEGEVLNFKISRSKWVYFDIADDQAKIRCFGTVYMLPMPIKDGMSVRITAVPRMHPQFGFSLNLQGLELSGEGSIKKASDLLQQKLDKEGLFAEGRKRELPYPPARIGLIASEESAAFKDFVKVLSARFGGIEIMLANVQVQGEAAPGQIVRAIDWFNKQADIPDVLVLIRGGGSADDLQAFSTEQVTRAVAASRIPTLVAIGHEVDVSLAELAADMRASTPSNAAELLVPDRRELRKELHTRTKELHQAAKAMVGDAQTKAADALHILQDEALEGLQSKRLQLQSQTRTLEALSPQAVLRRGYAVVRRDTKVIKLAENTQAKDVLSIQFADDIIKAEVQ